MPQVIDGQFDGQNFRFAIVAARFNSIFAEQLVDGAIDTLTRHGVDDASITVVRCPGSFELPQVAARVAEQLDIDAIVCLGVLIRGATAHFDYIASQAARGIGSVGTETGLPVTFGVITCDTVEQAVERSGSKAGNKGSEAAMAALEMVSLYESIDEYSE